MSFDDSNVMIRSEEETKRLKEERRKRKEEKWKRESV